MLPRINKLHEAGKDAERSDNVSYSEKGNEKELRGEYGKGQRKGGVYPHRS